MPRESRPNDAERTFLRSQRRAGVAQWRKPRKDIKALQEALKIDNVAFFKRILGDDVEAQMWMTFMTGKAPQLGPDDKPIINPVSGFPFLVDVELSPICLKAFLQAVAYKRGTPIATTENNTDEKKEIKVTWNILGATPEFFKDQAQATGLIRVSDPGKV